MASNSSAEIVQMDEARARRRQPEADAREYASLGAWLKAAREASGLSLAEVAERTHIRANYLDAIEAMDLGKLPQRPFVVGFVSAYAKQLGLDPATATRRFKEETGGGAPVEIEPEKFESVRRAEPELDRPEMSLWFALAVIASVLWCVVMVVTTAHTRKVPFSFNPAASAAEAAAARAAKADPAPAEPVAPAIVGLPAEPIAALIEAKAVERVEPVYPQRCEALASPRERVDVAFNVSSRGVVSGARVSTSTNACFNEAALNAIRRWKFEPRQVEGKAKAAYDLRYSFRFARPN